MTTSYYVTLVQADVFGDISSGEYDLLDRIDVLYVEGRLSRKPLIKAIIDGLQEIPNTTALLEISKTNENDDDSHIVTPDQTIYCWYDVDRGIFSDWSGDRKVLNKTIQKSFDLINNSIMTVDGHQPDRLKNEKPKWVCNPFYRMITPNGEKTIFAVDDDFNLLTECGLCVPKDQARIRHLHSLGYLK